MNSFILIFIIIAAAVVQATIAPLLAIKGVKPDILLIIVVSSALLSGKERGIGVGFFSGLLQDLASGTIFGTNTLSKLITGYVFGIAERKVFKEHIFLPILATMIATVFNNIIIIILLVMFGYKVDVITAISHNIVPLLLYNILICVPIHQVVYRITK